MCLHLPLVLLLLLCCLITSLPLLFSCPPGCCCPRPGVLILCESLGLHVLPRSVPLTTSALSVARNHLCNIDNVLRRYSSLQELSLGHNRLERFPRGLPASLESLQLQENRITFITAGDLRNLRNLTRLDLEDNRIRAIQPGALLSLMRLRMLSLKGNQLSSLPSHLPGSLMHLDVSANCISTLDLPSLAVLVNLQVLKINSNCLRSVPEHAFDGLKRLHSLELANNLWVCECNIMYLYRWLLMDRLRMATDLTTQTPHIPTPGEDPGCRNNTNSIQKGFLSTSVPIFFTSEAGVQVEATPRTLTQTSDPALVSLLSVLCVLTGLLLVIVILVLRSLLWRIQSVAPLQSTVSSQRNS